MLDTLIARASTTSAVESLRAEGILDRANGLIVDMTAVFNTAVVFVVCVVVLIVTLKGGFTVVKLVSSGLVGALVIWLVVGSGLVNLSGSVGSELESSATVVTIESHPALA
ncbi:hypothetical protein [Pseudoclavibacter sp. AY1H1]|uniref:hypothetical protein n=1 Tax=Pseudoclavibacter sp. AY1H1 TaxID=2080584 RepID=UPI000CE8E123|nr:hypothetical protein [Pseudoclavibacter sp. AY1H1]PPF32629.1 hypothetical protein C5E05_19180 [Pseudoclavibacter sp. AY1H1]